MSNEVISPCVSLMISAPLGLGFGLQELEYYDYLGPGALTAGQCLYAAGAFFASFTGGRYILRSLVGRVSPLTTRSQHLKSLIWKLAAITGGSLTLMAFIAWLGGASKEYVLSIVPADDAVSTIQTFALWGIGCIAASVCGSSYQVCKEHGAHNKLLESTAVKV